MIESYVSVKGKKSRLEGSYENDCIHNVKIDGVQGSVNCISRDKVVMNL